MFNSLQTKFMKTISVIALLVTLQLSVSTAFATPLTTLSLGIGGGACCQTATGSCVSGYFATMGSSGTAYWQYTVSTLGYSNITMGFNSSSSGTGPTTGQIWYNLGCGGADVFTGITYTAGASCGFRGPFTLPAACNNNPNLIVKLITAAAGSSGTNRVDINAFNGTAASFPSVAISTTSPLTGSVSVGTNNVLLQTFNLATTVATAT